MDDGPLAIDTAAHERLVGTGQRVLLRGDVDGLRDVVFDMLGKLETSNYRIFRGG